MSTLDWPGLLRWSLQYADDSSKTTPRSAEDLQFLKEAIESFAKDIPDVNKMVAEASAILNKAESINEIVSAVSVIVEASDAEPELARYMNKFEGLLPALAKHLFHEDFTVREKVAELLALVLPNNPSLQLQMYELGVLDQLFEEMCAKADGFALVDAEDKNRYFTKLASVLNGLVKNEPNADAAFRNRLNGHGLMKKLEATHYSRLKTKVDSMLDYLHVNPLAAAGPSASSPPLRLQDAEH